MWQKIEKHLQSRGWSMNRLAKEAGINQSMLVNLKKGRATGLSWGTMVKIADALDVSLDEFR